MGGALQFDRFMLKYREVSTPAARRNPRSRLATVSDHFADATEAHVASAQRPGISVVGLDQTGVVAVACLAHLGFPMLGVDIRADRAADLLDGNAPVQEARLERLLLDGVRHGRIKTSQNLISAVLATDVTLVMAPATGTAPASAPVPIAASSRAIGQALAMKSGYHIVVLVGDAPLGSLLGVVKPEIETASGKRLGADFGLCLVPQFGRAGTTVSDFFSPPKIVIGASDRRVAASLARFVALIDDTAIYTTIEMAEMAKRADGLWQATRAAFDDEVGRLGAALGLDVGEVMDIFRANVRSSPPQPLPAARTGRIGLAAGQDLRAVAALGRELGLALPLIDSLLARDAVKTC